MNAYPDQPDPINWDYYTRSISKPNLVMEFKKQYEALSVPYPQDKAAADMAALQKKTVFVCALCCKFENLVSCTVGRGGKECRCRGQGENGRTTSPGIMLLHSLCVVFLTNLCYEQTYSLPVQS
jgi:hypothetical protein